MSDFCIELEVSVVEKPAVTYAARCRGISATCTSSPEWAARRAAAKALNKSGKLRHTVGEADFQILLKKLDGYNRTYTARYELEPSRKARAGK